MLTEIITSCPSIAMYLWFNCCWRWWWWICRCHSGSCVTKQYLPNPNNTTVYPATRKSHTPKQHNCLTCHQKESHTQTTQLSTLPPERVTRVL